MYKSALSFPFDCLVQDCTVCSRHNTLGLGQEDLHGHLTYGHRLIR